MLTNDHVAFDKNRWYSFQNPILFDHKKFIFLYPYYQMDQEKLITRWRATIDIKDIEPGENRSDEDVLSARFKYAIKR